MKTAIISDIHANYQALKEVLLDIDRAGITDIVCLGDLVGYGPQPQEVVDTIMDRNIPTVMGNHDWGLLNQDKLGWFNPVAKQSILRTDGMLSKEAKSWLDQLPTHIIHNSCYFVHGTPPDSFLKYIIEYYEKNLAPIFNEFREAVSFVGHTHLLGLYTLRKEQVKTQLLIEGKKMLHTDTKYIVNSGSVGQPRDGNKNAKYLVYDEEEHSIEVKYVEYDIDITAKLIKEQNFPQLNASRLYMGY
ncbi:MAG: metallophosphatase family protein [Bacteroidales bacterium]|nr:metallophosphatase family protein [Bacteroidales bacterium]